MNERLITEPSVFLVTRPTVDWEKVAEFLEEQDLPGVSESVKGRAADSLSIAEISARLCYESYGRGRKDIRDFINNLLRSKDGSVFEHINYGFLLAGVSRSLTHELVRHRAGFAYSQRSQRYVDESAAKFVAPPALRNKGREADQYLSWLVSVFSESYLKMAAYLDEVVDEAASVTDRRKAVRQAARAVLPNMTETKIFVTANVRAWRHFLEMRGSAYADAEIRQLAIKILGILKEESPVLFADIKVEDSGTAAGPVITVGYSKV